MYLEIVMILYLINLIMFYDFIPNTVLYDYILDYNVSRSVNPQQVCGWLTIKFIAIFFIHFPFIYTQQKTFLASVKFSLDMTNQCQVWWKRRQTTICL